MDNNYFSNNRNAIKDGLKDGLPIGLGYFAVSFSLGIIAKGGGVTPLQCFVISFINHASAGEYAVFTCIRDNATYLELALMVFVANIRYVLMSCALSQRVNPEEGMLKRFIYGFTITDEIFAVEIAREGYLKIAYTLSAFLLAAIMWSTGTMTGCIAGSILPSRVVSALSVALYGMFLAIIIPPAKKDKIILVLIIISFVMSFLFARLPVISNISSGTRIVILTVLISSLAAVICPKRDGEMAKTSQD